MNWNKPYEVEKAYGKVTLNGLLTPNPTMPQGGAITFFNRLRDVIQNDAANWHVGGVTFQQGSLTGRIDIRCPHGQDLDWQISWHEMMNTQYPAELADQIGITIIKQCRSAHAKLVWGWTPLDYTTYQSYNYTDYLAQAQVNLAKFDWTEWDKQMNVVFSGASYGGVAGELIKLVPSLASMAAQCPRCTARASVIQLVPHINDDHKLTRGEIADWLESLGVDLTIKPADKPKEQDAHDGRSPRKKEPAAWEAGV